MKCVCEEPKSVDTCALISVQDMLLNVIGIKKQAVTNRDWDLYNVADRLENDLRLLLNENNHLERG